MKNTRLTLFLLFTLAFLFLVPTVYADEEDAVNLAEFPERLSAMLLIPLFSAQLLASTIVLALFILPTTFACSKYDRDVVIPTLFVGILSISFCIALTWLPVWIFVLLIFLVALMFGDRITGVFGK